MPNDLPDFTSQTSMSNIVAQDVTIVAGQSGTNITIDSPAVPLGTLSIATGASTNNANFTLPANCTGVFVAMYNTGANVVRQTLQLNGNTSNKLYANFTTALQKGEAFAIAIPGAAEGSVMLTVTWSANAIAGGPWVVAEVWALIGTGVQAVDNAPLEPLYVQPPLETDVSSAAFGQAIAANNNANVVAGVAGKRIKVWGFGVTIDANVPATVGVYLVILKGGTSGRVIHQWQFRWASNAGIGSLIQPFVTLPYPLALDAGEALVFACGGNAGATDIIGTVHYTQL